MKYMGSKRRIAKEILPIILAGRTPEQVYVESFCGGCNLIDKVPQGAGRIANDVHVPLISLLKALQEGWLPPEVVSEEEYKAARLLEDTNPLKGFIGFNCSFAGRYFEGYAREAGSNASTFATRGKNNLLKQLPNLLGIIFTSGSYQNIKLPEKSLIYCDPPYLGTKWYSSVKNSLNHEEFYDWCRSKHKEGHTIFVSEYAMPEDFTCVWSKEQVSSLTKDTGSKIAVERLFTLS